MTAPGATPSLVALLMTDVVGSTAMWQAHPRQMNAAMTRHHEIAAEVVSRNGGRLPIDQGEGDARFASFPSAANALTAALELQQSFSTEPWPEPISLSIRVGLHAGEVISRDGNLFGDPVNRCARIRGLAHGGQVLLSDAVRQMVATWLPDDWELLDLGEHRMKDLTQAERVFQLIHPTLTSEFPPLESLDRSKHNLPVQLSSFVGRQDEIASLAALLSDHQLVTLTGFGGMGKTRLALQVGADLATANDDGVWFVDLSAIRDPSQVPDAIARALGVSASAGPTDRALIQQAAGKRMLLILDNLEQLLPEAALQVAAIAAAGPEVRVLATSREPLGIRGERVVPLQPLAEPSRLFVDRASAADPRFIVDEASAQTIAAICAQLEGWPLAIELAAARVRTLGLDGLLARLHDRLAVLSGGTRDSPDRHRALRETIAWSYDLLPEAEQVLLARLSTFSGSASLAAIEEICGHGLGVEVMDALGSLVDKSLVNTVAADHGTRFALLESVRDFASECPRRDLEPNATGARHAAYFVNLFPGYEFGPYGSEFAVEIPNLDAALTTLLASRPEQCCALFLAVALRMTQVGEVSASISWCQKLLGQKSLDPITQAALVVIDASNAYTIGGAFTQRIGAARATITLLEAKAHPWLTGGGCMNLAFSHAERGDFDEAMTWAQRCVEVSNWSVPPNEMVSSLIAVAQVARLAQDFDRAIVIIDRALQHRPEEPDQEVRGLDALCRTLVDAGRPDEALNVGLRAIDAVSRPRSGWLASTLGAHGRALVSCGEWERGARQLVKSTLMFRDLGFLAFDLGWTAVAVARFEPDVGACILGATDNAAERTGDRTLWPPDGLLAPVRELCESRHSAALDRGRLMGWPAVAELLENLDLPSANWPD